MPLQATSGAASYDAFGGGVPAVTNYIEDVFSTYLYTGTGANGLQIQNGIDLAGKGGLVIGKARSGTEAGTVDFGLVDTTRGGSSVLSSNSPSGAQATAQISSFNSNGFTLNGEFPLNYYGSPYTYASWTFAKQPKFFDVVTYTGTGSARTITHNLGSAPGCIIVKRTNDTGNWQVYHQSLGATQYVVLNSTLAAATSSDRWNNTAPTSSVFTVGVSSTVNGSGATYVAYLFAHDAGGFGLTGTDNVISCGSFTTDSSGNATVNLGYEPQYILMKKTSGVQNWVCYDTMRGWAQAQQAQLYPNITQAEDVYTGSPYFFPTATGFSLSGTFGLGNNDTFIYIAIRRGPMKVPTSGTSVFSPIAYTGNSTTNTTVQNLTTSFAGDAVIIPQRTGGNNPLFFDKLRGGTKAIYTSLTLAEETITAGESVGFNNTQTVLTGQYTAQGNYNYSGDTFVSYNFKRAPSFFDEVCYLGNGGYVSRNHNLAAVPEMMIVKARSTTSNWSVYHSALGFENYVRLNTTAASAGTGDFWYLTPTATQFSTGGYADIDDTGVTYVNYLFATCAGVSKVGSYTGTGTTKQIDCGFTGGARLVLIKRTDSTGSWYVWDSSRGIVSGNDPYLLLNSTAAEVTNTDYIDTYSAGFEISSTAPAEINASGGSFIFLAIA